MSELTDEQVSAELRDQWERDLWNECGYASAVWIIFQRIALSRIEARESSAREREEIAAKLYRLCDVYADEGHITVGMVCGLADDLDSGGGA